MITTSPSCTVSEVYITAFTMHVTACDLGTSFSFDMTVRIMGYMRFLVRV